jgi:hypothetical protein
MVAAIIYLDPGQAPPSEGEPIIVVGPHEGTGATPYPGNITYISYDRLSPSAIEDAIRRAKAYAREHGITRIYVQPN